MAKLKYLPVFFDVLEDLEDLSDESFGKAVRAALVFMENGTEPEGLDQAESLAFKTIRKAAKQSADKYEVTCQKRKASADKRWAEHREMQMDANASKSMQTDANGMQTDANDAKNKEQRTKNNTTFGSNNNMGAASAPSEAVKKPRKKPEKKTEEPMTPPTVDEVRAYCTEKGITTLDPQYFVDYYTEARWVKSNGNPVKNWKLTVMEWSRREIQSGKGPPPKTPYQPQPDEYPF